MRALAVAADEYAGLVALPAYRSACARRAFACHSAAHLSLRSSHPHRRCARLMPSLDDSLCPTPSHPWVCSDSHAHLLVPSSASTPPLCCTNEVAESDNPSAASPATSPVTGPASSGAVRLNRVVVCGTHPARDWAAIAALSQRAVGECGGPGPRLVLGFGIHPWYLPEMDDDLKNVERIGEGAMDGVGGAHAHTPTELLAQLEAHLVAHPTSIVGEIGLDKLRGPSQAAQAYFFLEQVRLAARLHRPVSVHCVRHYGLLLDLLDKGLVYSEDVPPAIVIHGFTGSCGVARSLLKMRAKKASRAPAAAPVKISERIFFGVGRATSLTVKDFRSATLPLLLAGVVPRRVLLETDRFHSSGLMEGGGTREERETVGGMLAPVLDAVAVALTEADATTSPALPDAAPMTADVARRRAAESLEDTFDLAFAAVRLT